jgi:predicted phage terminase large subunit-like protein
MTAPPSEAPRKGGKTAPERDRSATISPDSSKGSGAAPEPSVDDVLRQLAAVAARDDLATFSDTLGIGTPAKHHTLICRAMQSMLVDDDCDVLVLLMPPGSAKSTYGSVALPAWTFARDPAIKVLQVSNGELLAESWGRRVRNIIGGDVYPALFPGTQLAPDSAAAGRWNTTRGGGYLALGAGASILGFRADLAIIDDPHKSLEDATSEVTSAKLRTWFDNDLMTRLTPNGKIVLIMQRLAWGDLAGHVMQRYGSADSPRRLKVIRLPMECETGTDDPLFRLPGERLWPEWFTEQMVDDAKRDHVRWRTLYQQQPIVGTSEFCSRDQITIVDRAPPLEELRIIHASDFALGERSDRGDYTAHVTVGVDRDGNWYVLRVWRDRQPPLQAIDAMLNQAAMVRPIALVADKDMIIGSLQQFIYERQQALGVHVRLALLPTGGRDKRARAASLEGVIALRRLHLVRAPWNEVLINELVEFPVGKHDDQVDCLSLIARHLVEIGRGHVPEPQRPAIEVRCVQNDDGVIQLVQPLEDLFEDNDRRYSRRR